VADELRDKWLKRLADEDKAHQPFRKRAADAEKEALDYTEGADGPAFPIFKNTVDLIHGRIYGQPPKPDVRKRHPSSSQGEGQAEVAGPLGPDGTPAPQPAPAGYAGAGGNVPQ